MDQFLDLFLERRIVRTNTIQKQGPLLRRLFDEVVKDPIDLSPTISFHANAPVLRVVILALEDDHNIGITFPLRINPLVRSSRKAKQVRKTGSNIDTFLNVNDRIQRR